MAVAALCVTWRPRRKLTCVKVGSVSYYTMFTFTLIDEDAVLLIVTLIDAALLSILLLISLRTCTPAVRTYILALFVFAVLSFLFLHEQILDISEPIIEHFKQRQHNSSTATPADYTDNEAFGDAYLP